MGFKANNQYGRKQQIIISKIELKMLLEIGMSYREIARLVKCSKATIFEIAKRYELQDFNAFKQYNKMVSKKCKKIVRVNTHLVKYASAFMDRTEISFRREKSKHTRVAIKGTNFITLGKEGTTKLYFLENHRKEGTINALIYLRKYLSEKDIVLIDTEFNTHGVSEIKFCNSEGWHPIKNLVEKYHGFKYSIIVKFWRRKTSSYNKLSEKDKIMLLKIYIETCALNDNYEIVNLEDLKEYIRKRELVRSKIIQKRKKRKRAKQ